MKVVISLCLLILASNLLVAVTILARDRLQAGLLRRNRDLRNHLTILSLAEALSGIGRWHYDLRSGKQHWSDQMLRLNGLDPRLGPDPGDMRPLLPDDGEALFSQLGEHRTERRPFSFEYEVHPPEGDSRILRMHAQNEFDEKGMRVAIFAVAMDVTEQHRKVAAMASDRHDAMRQASEALHLANTDALTGLANRRLVLDELRRHVEAQGPLSIVIFDIDHFKQVNDGFGHLTGDEVLVKVSSLARRQVRASDTLGRIGGEEFLWLLPDVGEREARDLAERLRRAIAGQSSAGGLPPVTASVGIASLRESDTPESLFGRADCALYAAKEDGRNRVRLAA